MGKHYNFIVTESRLFIRHMDVQVDKEFSLASLIIYVILWFTGGMFITQGRVETCLIFQNQILHYQYHAPLVSILVMVSVHATQSPVSRQKWPNVFTCPVVIFWWGYLTTHVVTKLASYVCNVRTYTYCNIVCGVMRLRGMHFILCVSLDCKPYTCLAV